MFTGLIQQVGKLVKLEKKPAGGAMTISCSWDTRLEDGESVCVQGACLTVTSSDALSFTCNVLEETLLKTNLLSKQPGSLLNLERAMQVGDRFGGHFVTGHVDGTGNISSVSNSNGDQVIKIDCSEEMLRGIVLKGSVTCDGVSLTVSSMYEKGFCVSIIPFTWKHTSLTNLEVGASINLETDMLGKYVQKYTEGQNASALTMESLNNAGFM